MDNMEDRVNNIWFVAGFGALAVFLCALYLFLLGDVIHDETENYLSGLSEKTVQIVKGEIDDNFSNLEIAARAVELLSKEDDAGQKIMNFMGKAGNTYKFSRIGVVSENGFGWLADGHAIDFSNEEYIKSALNGERAISDLTVSSIDGKDILVYAVPIREENGSVCGALVWSRTVGALHDNLKVKTFYNEGHSHLLRNDGKFIMETEQDVMPQDVINGDFNRVLGIGAGIVISFILICLLLVTYVWRLQRRHMEKFRKLAFEDPVTGGGNITYFRETAKGLIRKAPPGTYAMVSMDINSFKLINVTFGQEAGDRTLKYVYEILRENLEPGEIAARMSQDRFRLLLKNAPMEQLVKRLEKSVEQIEQYNENLERKYFLSFSAGIRVVEEPDDNIIIIGDQVNMARKKAKTAPVPGGGLLSWAVYEPQDKTELMRSKEILDGVDRAIKNHEFTVYLQPKIDLSTRKLVGAEALVRWILPDKTIIRPDEFIPILELNGQISKLDLYMFREVCRILKNWEERGLSPVPISVNFSRVNMAQSRILEQYQTIQEEEGISPKLLEVELTETMIQGDMEYFRQFVDEIHRMGYQCSLDDFGSGYSSLNTLKDISVDVLKLDRQFFREQNGGCDRDRQIIHGIIQIARSLGIRTVAEGVEEEEQVRMLAEMGCDMVQGFYYSKPVPVTEFEEKYTKQLNRQNFGGRR